jgi:hypothetical protein
MQALHPQADSLACLKAVNPGFGNCGLPDSAQSDQDGYGEQITGD